MQLALKQLDAHLKQKLAPVYLISGDVPFLIQEARDKICASAKQAGYEDRELLSIEPNFNWERFNHTALHLNLFSYKTIIDLRHPTAKFDAQATKALTHYLDRLPPEKLLIISTNKLTRAQQQTRWHKAISKVGVTIPIWPIPPKELLQWIQMRFKSMGMNADPNSIQLLANLTEGNLLATQQAIEKLKLLYPDTNITVSELAQAICNNARYTVFDLTNYALQGHHQQVLCVMNGLRDTGVEPTFILWALCHEIRGLIQLSEQLQQGVPTSQLLNTQWSSRKPLLKAALSRFNLRQLTTLLQMAVQIDHKIKGIIPGHYWDDLTDLSLSLAGINLIHLRSANAEA